MQNLRHSVVRCISSQLGQGLSALIQSQAVAVQGQISLHEDAHLALEYVKGLENTPGIEHQLKVGTWMLLDDLLRTSYAEVI